MNTADANHAVSIQGTIQTPRRLTIELSLDVTECQKGSTIDANASVGDMGTPTR